MALRKRIKKRSTGQYNEYWSVDAVGISRPKQAINIVLAGYADTSAYGQYAADDYREWVIRGTAFSGVVGRTLMTDLRSAGHPVDSWPAEVRAVLELETTYNVVARGAYGVIKSTRRAMPVGAVIQPGGDVLLPTGETVPAADVDGLPDAPTIPSEFADAVDV